MSLKELHELVKVEGLTDIIEALAFECDCLARDAMYNGDEFGEAVYRIVSSKLVEAMKPLIDGANDEPICNHH